MFAQVTQHAVAVGTDGPANAGSMSMCVCVSLMFLIDPTMVASCD